MTMSKINSQTLVRRIAVILLDLRIDPKPETETETKDWYLHRNDSLTFWAKLKSKTRSGGTG
jgi:hypothetical protein